MGVSAAVLSDQGAKIDVRGRRKIPATLAYASAARLS